MFCSEELTRWISCAVWPQNAQWRFSEVNVNEEEIAERDRPTLPSKADAATQARTVLRSRRSAALATVMATEEGWPYASLVTVACDVDGSPILLLSRLSDHTRNLDRDPRASLLLEDASRRVNPQTGPRLTLLGRIVPEVEPRLRRRFLARHPGAALYADFTDFRIFRMQVERGHWVGGFGQARWLESEAILADPRASQALAEAEPAVLEHMNADRAASIDLYANRLLGRSGTGWRLIALDPHGCDLVRGTAFARLSFPQPVADASELRAILDELDRTARGSV
jgi:heme oxygenase (biliverdin-IX-beta and delta-forming)